MVGGCGHTHAAGLMGMAVEAAVLEVGIHCADGWNGGVVTGILFGGRGDGNVRVLTHWELKTLLIGFALLFF